MAYTFMRTEGIWAPQPSSISPAICGDLDEACTLRARREVDYGESQLFAQGILRIRDDLPDIVNGGEFANQMRRFVPAHQYERTVARPAFRVALAESVGELYDRCIQQG